MGDTTSKDYKENIEDIKDIIIEKINEVKYDNNEGDYTLEISRDNKEAMIEEENPLNIDKDKCKDREAYNGEIIVTAVLECGEHEILQGVKINLYKINGLSPILVKSKITDKDGKVIFSEIEEGCYRVIEIIDKKYFEKPKYINWNEIIIDKQNYKQKIVIVNKIKKNVLQKNITFKHK